jgi:hypothetical protein
LKIESFRCGIGADQDVGLMFAEPSFDFFAADAFPGAVISTDLPPRPEKHMIERPVNSTS